jgi:hypothetical protein
MRFLALLFVLAATFVGCVGGPVLTASGYQLTDQPFAIAYAEPKEGKRFIGSDWLLVSHSKEGKLRQDMVGQVSFDTDNDGKTDVKREFPRYELMLKHRTDESRVNVSRVILAAEERDTELLSWLRNRTRNYVDGERRWTSKPRAESTLTMGSFKGAEIVLEVADTDRLKLAPGALDRIVRVTVFETPLVEKAGAAMGASTEYKIRLVFTYSAAPEVFERHLAEVDALLNATSFGTERGISARTPVELDPAATGTSANPVPSPR